MTRRLLSRSCETIYYRWCFSQNNLKSSVHVNDFDDTICRFCGSHVESVEHVLVNCYALDHNSFRQSCLANGLVYNVSTLLSEPSLKIVVESFIRRYFIQGR